MRYVSICLLASALVLLVLLGSVGIAQTGLGEYWYRYGPYVDKVTFPVMKDYTIRLLAFEAGELSLVDVLPIHLNRIKTNRPDAHVILITGFSFAGVLHFNVQRWPVNYLELRQALAHLWNRDKIIAESPLRGLAAKCTTNLPPTYGAWVNWDADYERLYPYNPEKAKELLSKVFTPCTGPDGKPAWCDPREGGKVVEIEILSLPEATIPTYWWIAQYIKEEAEKIGLRVTVKAVGAREMDAAMSAGMAQAWVIGWGLPRFPYIYYYIFHSKEIRPGGWNFFRVNNSKLDDLLNKFYYAKNPEEARTYLWQAQEILAKEVVPWIPTYTSIAILAFDGKIVRESILLMYAPPFLDPVGYSILTLSTIRFKDRKFGGVLNYYHTVDITTYHPATYLWATEYEVFSRVYLPLQLPRPEDIYAEPRAPIFLKYWGIEEVEYRNQRAFKFTMTLFEGIRWQDGVEMTAEDIAYTVLKFGRELKTRLYYKPYIEAIIDVVVVNKTTVEFYLKDYGWLDIYDLTELMVLPKHIFEKLPDPLRDPSTLPHPTLPGFTAMVGNGPFALAKPREITYAELVWNPWYYWRHPERTVKFSSVKIPETVNAGTSFKISVTLVDYLGSVATNATVTVSLLGPTVLKITATHVGGGTYEVTVPGLTTGTYDVEVHASQPYGPIWTLDNTYRTKIAVGAVTGPGPVGPTIERPPAVVVEIPGIPPIEITPPPIASLKAPKVEITPPKIDMVSTETVGRAVKAVETVTTPVASYVAAALGIVALGVATVVRRK